MIQKKYVAILAVIVLLLVGGILYSPYLDWYMFPQNCADRELVVQPATEEDTTLNHQYLWFEYDGDDMVLCYREEASGFTTISYLGTDGTYAESLLEDFQTSNDMAGTFLVITNEAVSLDIDGDGEPENVRFAAKTDNNSCKTFYGYDHAFLQDFLPVDFVMNYWRAADLYVYGELYTGSIEFETSLNIHETREIEEGYVSGISYTNQEAGVMIVTLEYEDEVIVISYTQENNVWNRQHLRALQALGVLLIAIISLIFLMHYVRVYIRKRTYGE